MAASYKECEFAVKVWKATSVTQARSFALEAGRKRQAEPPVKAGPPQAGPGRSKEKIGPPLAKTGPSSPSKWILPPARQEPSPAEST